MSAKSLSLKTLSLPLKLLFTGYLLCIGFGLGMAGVQILLTHGMADGKLGLSVDDIVYSYYGDRKGSVLEAKLNGSMKDKASLKDRTKIIKWVQQGSLESEWDGGIKKVFAQNCVACHNAASSLPDFSKYAVVQERGQADQGTTITQLTRVSHIHLFGIAFIFMFVGGIFSLSSGFSNILKGTLIIIPFAFLVLDILSWWLTKIDPAFAWLTIIGGFGYSLASTTMFSVSLYQMWISPLKNPK